MSVHGNCTCPLCCPGKPYRTVTAERVVSEPGAAVTITELELTDEMKKALSVGDAKLPPAKPDPLAVAARAWREVPERGQREVLGSLRYLRYDRAQSRYERDQKAAPYYEAALALLEAAGRGK